MRLAVHAEHHGIGLKIFDYLLASSDGTLDINITGGFDPSADLNILFVARDQSPVGTDIDRYDLIMMSNNDEPLTVANTFMIDNIYRPNAYVVCNSFVTNDHPLRDKIIFVNNDSLVCRQYWTNAIFPQYHEIKSLEYEMRSRPFVFVNGQNRSWRHHYVQNITRQLPGLDVISNISRIIHETNDAPWETTEDTQFREFVNAQYAIQRNQPTDYYDRGRKIAFISRTDGLPESAELNLGYFIMPEYYDTKCVIFPESNWLNNELSMTEKVFKCFYAGAMPWPIGGANIHALYDQLGFVTAWHFLPRDLQVFDQVLDHERRSRMIIDAMTWFMHNQTVLDSQEVQQALAQNLKRFLTNTLDVFCVHKLHALISDTTGGRQFYGHA